MKALYLEHCGTRMDGLRQVWEGACSSHSDLGRRKHRTRAELPHQGREKAFVYVPTGHFPLYFETPGSFCRNIRRKGGAL